VTVFEHLAIHRHLENLIGIGKSTADDAHDDHDDEMQRFSKGVEHSAVRSRNGLMRRQHGEHKRDKARRCSRPARTFKAGIAQHTSSYSRRLMTEIDDLTTHTTPLPHSSNERDSEQASYPRLVTGTRWSMSRREAGQWRDARTPSKVSGVPRHQNRPGGR
jgi:hypothetical protein